MASGVDPFGGIRQIRMPVTVAAAGDVGLPNTGVAAVQLALWAPLLLGLGLVLNRLGARRGRSQV